MRSMRVTGRILDQYDVRHDDRTKIAADISASCLAFFFQRIYSDKYQARQRIRKQFYDFFRVPGTHSLFANTPQKEINLFDIAHPRISRQCFVKLRNTLPAVLCF